VEKTIIELVEKKYKLTRGDYSLVVTIDARAREATIHGKSKVAQPDYGKSDLSIYNKEFLKFIHSSPETIAAMGELLLDAANLCRENEMGIHGEP